MDNLWKKVLNEEVFDIEVLEDAIKTYYFSTGIDVFAIDEKGNTIAACGEKTRFCNFFKNCKGNEYSCKKAHLYSSKQSQIIGEGYIFFCPAGLVHYTAPIIKNKIFKGAIVAGPILMNYPDDIFIDDLFLNNSIDVNLKGKVSNYLREIPVVETARVRYLSKMLFTMTNSLMTEEKSDIMERNEKMHQQAKIGESIHNIKENLGLKSEYPYEKEKELLLKVKNGDDLGAKATLNELLGYVFFTGGGSIEVIKARALELCTLLSRAAVESGAAPDKMFRMNYKFIGELSSINDIEDLSYWTLKVLDRFMEDVFNFTSLKNREVIKKAINYVNKNYMNNITLNSISENLYLNASYFSTLFRKETGVNFSDYLNKVRIEESKKLLKDGRYSILQISMEVGFEDQSYYSKVFKKFTGLTPKEYKDN
jgi:AraC-like DNA-binding protein/ligand-binding sensor protein